MEKGKTNFRELMKKYEGKTPEQKRAIKRKVHADGYGGQIGKLVAYGKLNMQTSDFERKCPHFKGKAIDAGSGKEFIINMWWNDGTPRFEILKEHTSE